MSTVRERLRAALPVALAQRDTVLVTALRTTLAALDNAEAVPAREPDPGSLAIEGTPVGVGIREAPRRALSDADVERLVRAEIDERRVAARVYEQADRPEQARRLHHEADTLAAAAGLAPDRSAGG